jgi:hypothetical protein
VHDEIHDLAGRIAKTECRTAEGLCAKIRCLMAHDGVDTIERIRIDEGIAEEVTFSIFRDLFAMARSA